MKRIIALVLAALLLCGMGSALAEEYQSMRLRWKLEKK